MHRHIYVKRGRYGAALITSLLLVGLASPSWAVDISANRKCRAAIGSKVVGVDRQGMASQEKCHDLANKANVASGICSDTQTLPFEIIDTGAYDKVKGKAQTALSGPTTPAGKELCPTGTTPETLDNYPNGDITKTFDKIDGIVEFGATQILGGADLNGDKALIACQKAISAARKAIVSALVSDANKCMAVVDHPKAPDPTPSTFGGLSTAAPDCLQPDFGKCSVTTTTKCSFDADCPPLEKCGSNTQKAIDKAVKLTAPGSSIPVKCGTAPTLIPGYPSGAAVGSCSPLPQCVVDAALAEARNAAFAVYPSKSCSGTLVPAARTVTVSLNAGGVTLGGADLRIDYPHFQSSLPENGIDTAVQTAITFPLGTALANDLDDAVEVSLGFTSPFSSGVAFTAAFDKCAPLEAGQCSVTGPPVTGGVNGLSPSRVPDCRQNSDCAPRCLELSKGGNPLPAFPSAPGSQTLQGANSFCTRDSDCPLLGVDGVTPNPAGQKCLCPGCAPKKCVASGTPCEINSECGAANASKQCDQITTKACTVDADCSVGLAPLLYGAAHCGNAAHGGAAVGVCVVPRTKACTTDANCNGDAGQALSKCYGDAAGGGFCVAQETCIPEAKVCSISQYLSCDRPGDPACPLGEACVAQSSLTKCTVLDALDDFGQPLDGVTCTVNITEP